MQRNIRIIAFTLILCVLLASMPIISLALDTDNFAYTLNADNSVTLTAYNGTDADVVIPSYVNGMPVTAIGESAFADNVDLQSVTFPDTLTSIGSQAFKSCVNLTSVSFPNSLTAIETQAFFSCSSLATIEASPYLVNVGLQAFHNTIWYVNAPKGALYIGRVLYRYIGTLPEGSEVTVADYTASICANAFENQYNLQKCYLPVGLRSIGDYAFSNCSSLTYVRIPMSVSSFGSNIFFNAGTATIHGVPQSPAYIYALENEVYFSSDASLNFPDGDMDKDHELTSSDIRVLMKALLLSIDCDHERFLSCDIIYDGKIATNDIREWLLLSLA